MYDNGVRAAVVHHTAGSNDYAPQDSAGIVRSIYAYHTRTLGWCDIAYNALVDKYGQVFEGRAGGIDQARRGLAHRRLQPRHLGRGDDRQLRRACRRPRSSSRTMGRLLGWRLGMDGVDPKGTVALASAGGAFTHFAGGDNADAADDLHPSRRRQHRLPGQHRLRADRRDPGHRRAFQGAARSRRGRGSAAGRRDLSPTGRTWAAWTARWARRRRRSRPVTASTRYATFDKGAVYWSPDTGAEPRDRRDLRGLGVAGLRARHAGIADQRRDSGTGVDQAELPARHPEFRPVSSGTVTRVIDGVPEELPPPSPDGPPVQLERFAPVGRH